MVTKSRAQTRATQARHTIHDTDHEKLVFAQVNFITFSKPKVKKTKQNQLLNEEMIPAYRKWKPFLYNNFNNGAIC